VAIAGSDWRDAKVYDRLLPGDRRCFAWEWLRRSSAYNDAWAHGGEPERFGLLRLENPALGAIEARPIWSAACDGAVLNADGRPADSADRLEFAKLSRFATIVPGPGNIQRILLSDGLHSIRLDLAAATLSLPLALMWHIDGVRNLRPQIIALAQFGSLATRGQFAPALYPRERRARRWIAMLRVHDALAMDAVNREIVEALFNVRVAGPNWRIGASAWRLRVQRLAVGGRACLAMSMDRWLGSR
jgi:hypothetical protein